MDNDWTLEERPKRHQGAYKPEKRDIPFELSRGKIGTYRKCPKCFMLEKACGLKLGMAAWLLNTNTDTLLKKDFDQYRGKEPHPIMVKAGLEHLIPFEHEDIEKWEDALQFGLTPNHFNTWHRESNILFGGGLDDVWQNKETGELHIVDYKSTSQQAKITKPLDETFLAPPDDPKMPDYKAGYRRQMDMYQWIARRKGFEVSNTGYFLYVDGQHHGIDGMIDKNDPATAWMKFNTAIIPYEGDDSWIEPTLMKIKSDIEQIVCVQTPSGVKVSGPEMKKLTHSIDCEDGKYLLANSRYHDAGLISM